MNFIAPSVWTKLFISEQFEAWTGPTKGCNRNWKCNSLTSCCHSSSCKPLLKFTNCDSLLHEQSDKTFPVQCLTNFWTNNSLCKQSSVRLRWKLNAFMTKHNQLKLLRQGHFAAEIFYCFLCLYIMFYEFSVY